MVRIEARSGETRVCFENTDAISDAKTSIERMGCFHDAVLLREAVERDVVHQFFFAA